MPEMPEGCEQLWLWFQQLCGTRQTGMAPNPITYQEIEAFERKALVRLTAFETDVIMRLDAAVRAVWAGQIAKPTPKPNDPTEPIPADNVGGLKALFRGMAVKKQAQLDAKQSRGAKHV